MPVRPASDTLVLLGLPDGAYRSGGAAPNVESRETPGALDLIPGRLTGDLQVAVQQHPHPGGPHGVPATDQAAARVNRQSATPLGEPAVDRVTAAAGLGDAEVVDRHVLR